MDYRNLERLLLHDSADPTYQSNEHGNVRSAGRVLVWSSDTQLELLFGSEKLHMDGTFSSSPSIFEQVFIIQAFLYGTCVPVVYALLPDRKAIIYVHLLNVLSDEARKRDKKFDPSLIMTDFEPGIAKAISLEFSEKTIQKGCFFHFCQSIYRHVQKLGLSTTYLENMTIRSTIRQMMALALVPETHVTSLYADLCQELDDVERLELFNLFKYFSDYWMRHVSTWNVYDVSDRTNNYSEGYNNRFKKRLQKTHPNVWLFIDSIRKEVDTVHDMIRQINSGMQPRTKRSKTRIAERRIDELYDRFRNGRITERDLLRGLSLFAAQKNKKIIRCDQINQKLPTLLTLHSPVMKGHFSEGKLSMRTIILRTIFKGRFASRKHILEDIFPRTIRLKDIGKDIIKRTFLPVTTGSVTHKRAPPRSTVAMIPNTFTGHVTSLRIPACTYERREDGKDYITTETLTLNAKTQPTCTAAEMQQNARMNAMHRALRTPRS